MLTVSRRKLALDPPLYIVLMDDLALQSKQPCLVEDRGAVLSQALSTGRNLISAPVETI